MNLCLQQFNNNINEKIFDMMFKFLHLFECCFFYLDLKKNMCMSPSSQLIEYFDVMMELNKRISRKKTYVFHYLLREREKKYEKLIAIYVRILWI